MNKKEILSEIAIILVATLVLAISISFKDQSLIYVALASFLIIIVVNVLVKKIVGYFFEIDVKTKFWSWYQIGLRADYHFAKPLPMVWLPLVISLMSKGFVWWLGILEFDIKAKTERVAKRHGLYRFTQVTEWHVAWIALWGIIANLIMAIIAYIIGFETFAKLSFYFIAWSLIPLSGLDGTKILMGSRPLWLVSSIIGLILLVWGFII
jgi:hypothetical protein